MLSMGEVLSPPGHGHSKGEHGDNPWHVGERFSRQAMGCCEERLAASSKRR